MVDFFRAPRDYPNYITPKSTSANNSNPQEISGYINSVYFYQHTKPENFKRLVDVMHTCSLATTFLKFPLLFQKTNMLQDTLGTDDSQKQNMTVACSNIEGQHDHSVKFQILSKVKHQTGIITAVCNRAISSKDEPLFGNEIYYFDTREVYDQFFKSLLEKNYNLDTTKSSEYFSVNTQFVFTDFENSLKSFNYTPDNNFQRNCYSTIMNSISESKKQLINFAQEISLSCSNESGHKKHCFDLLKLKIESDPNTNLSKEAIRLYILNIVHCALIHQTSTYGETRTGRAILQLLQGKYACYLTYINQCNYEILPKVPQSTEAITYYNLQNFLAKYCENASYNYPSSNNPYNRYEKIEDFLLAPEHNNGQQNDIIINNNGDEVLLINLISQLTQSGGNNNKIRCLRLLKRKLELTQYSLDNDEIKLYLQQIVKCALTHRSQGFGQTATGLKLVQLLKSSAYKQLILTKSQSQNYFVFVDKERIDFYPWKYGDNSPLKEVERFLVSHDQEDSQYKDKNVSNFPEQKLDGFNYDSKSPNNNNSATYDLD